MFATSKNVTSQQKDIHENLISTLEKYDSHHYQRPIADFSIETLRICLDKAKTFDNKIILDLGCGTGESSFHLAQKYTEALVIGIDKSIDRLDRNNSFKKNLPKNCMLVRGELLDLIYLFNQESIKRNISIIKIYILYPNPWPKAKHFKRRFACNPVTPFLFKIPCPVEIRSNWKVYLLEMNAAATFFNRPKASVESFRPEKTITAFERKYLESNQQLFFSIINFE